MILLTLVEQIQQWLDFPIWGGALKLWLIALAVGIVAFIVLTILFSFLKKRVAHFTSSTKTEWDDVLSETMQATRSWFLVIVSVFLGSIFLDLSTWARDVVQTVVTLTALLQAALWGNRLIKYGIDQYLSQHREKDPALATSIVVFRFIGNLILWSLVAILAMENMGIDVTALVAGLGIGGIAVALAAQNILGDLFSSLSIVWDKPFVLGDFIIVGDKMGTVENIGLKTTRVRALSGEQLIFTNTDLLESRIHNYKRMQERRVVFHIGVTYETSHEKLAAIPAMLQEIIEAREQIRFDRCHFSTFGDFALNFETVYYVLVADYAVYMDVQQAINLAIFEKFSSEEIEFAYPTQKLFLERST